MQRFMSRSKFQYSGKQQPQAAKKGGECGNMAKKDIEKYQFTSAQSRTEAARNGRKGGKASGEKRRQIKSFREAAEWGLAMTANANVNGEQMQVTQYQRIIIMLLSMLNDPEDKRFFQAAQMLAQFRSSGYAEEKMIAEIERIKAETKRLQGDTEQHNGMLEDLIKGLQSDVHTETESPDADVANGQTEKT